MISIRKTISDRHVYFVLLKNGSDGFINGGLPHKNGETTKLTWKNCMRADA